MFWKNRLILVGLERSRVITCCALGGSTFQPHFVLFRVVSIVYIFCCAEVCSSVTTRLKARIRTIPMMKKRTNVFTALHIMMNIHIRAGHDVTVFGVGLFIVIARGALLEKSFITFQIHAPTRVYPSDHSGEPPST
jgi:hypothetical protein